MSEKFLIGSGIYTAPNDGLVRYAEIVGGSMKFEVGKLVPRIGLRFPRDNKWFELVLRDVKILLSLDDFDLVAKKIIWVSVGGYVYCYDRGAGRGAKQELVHLIIADRIGISSDKLVIDHINRRPYDNRRENLRAISHNKNSLNSDRSDRASFVHYSSQKDRWCFEMKRKGLPRVTKFFLKKAEAISYAKRFREENL